MIDGMTLAEAGEIFAYWERDPPAHLMLQTIARMLGWKPHAAQAARLRVDDIAAAAPPGLVVSRAGAIAMPPPLLDPETLRARNRARAVEIARRNQSA